MEAKQTNNAPKEQTQSNTKKGNSPKEPKKKNNKGKAKPVNANELLNAQPTQPPPQANTQQHIPQPQGQQAYFVPVVPVMAYNFPNAPIQGQQQQFFAAMPFGAHQPPVPGAPMPQMQQTPGYTQYYPMQQQVPQTMNFSPNNNGQKSSPQSYSNGKNGTFKKYQEKPQNGKVKEHYRDNQKDSGLMIYQKYKTTLCKHYEETQTCSLGHLCSFAHSKSELRSINDPMPKDFAGKKSQIGALHSNYRTQMCRNWEQTGICKFAAMCCFAHGDDQLRNMIDPVPQRVPENLLFPLHMQKGGPGPRGPRSDQYSNDDYQGVNYQGDYDQQDMNGDYEQYSQQDYGDMQPQDFNAEVYWQTEQPQTQFFTGHVVPTPVWSPAEVKMPQAPAQAFAEHKTPGEPVAAESITV